MSETPTNRPEELPPTLPSVIETMPVSAVPHHQLSFLQQEWVQTLLPFLTSVLFHIGILIVGYVGYKTIENVSKPAIEEQTVIADTGYTEGEVGGIPNPGLGEDPSRPAAQDQLQNVQQSDSWASKPSETLSQSVMSGGAGEAANEMSVIGLGASTGSGKSAGTGSGDGSGSGEGGGPPAAFGVPGGGGGIGPKFMGVGSGARTRKIVYLCDVSGTMMQYRTVLQTELRRSISELKSAQFFNIVFFREEKTEAVNKDALLQASVQNKALAGTFIDEMTVTGGTDPIPGLKLAFAQKPEVIYILTDGFDHLNMPYDELAKFISNLNREKRVKIITLYVPSGGGDDALEKILAKIALDSGGKALKLDLYKLQ